MRAAEAKHGPLVYALARLSERERRLLGLLAGLFLPLALVFAALLPLLEARDAAREAAREQAAMLGWVAAQVRALPAEGAAPAAVAAAADPVGISAIEKGLVQAGLRGQVVELSNRDDGGVDLALEAVPFAALADWLAQAAPGWGYRIAAFRIELAEPGLVRARFELEPGA